MKNTIRSITVITTPIQKITHYVKRATGRQDGRFNVELSSNLKDAYDFSKSKTNEIARNIYNPHDRVYTVEDTLLEA